MDREKEKMVIETMTVKMNFFRLWESPARKEIFLQNIQSGSGFYEPAFAN